MLNQILNIK